MFQDQDILKQFSDAHINCAMITPELLFNLAPVLVDEQPAGPLFLNALSSLVEACVLHEHVFIAPHFPNARLYRRGWQVYGPMLGGIEASDFAQTMLEEGGLELFYPTYFEDDQFPSAEQIVNHIIRRAGFDESYEFMDYYAQVDLAHVSFASQNSEIDQFRSLEDLFKIDGIFSVVEGAFANPLDQPRPGEIEAVEEARKLRFSQNDIEIIAGANLRAKALESLARAMNMSLYSDFMSMPHFAADLKRCRTRFVEELRRRMQAELGKVPDLDTVVRDVEIPALCQNLLQTIKDKPAALADAILSFREKHAPLRHALTELETDYFSADSRQKQKAVLIRFERAWKGLLRGEEMKNRRWLLRVGGWIAAIARGLPVVLEKLIALDDVSEARRLKGLHAYWNEVWAAPPTRENHRLLKRAFGINEDEYVWKAFAQASEKINGGFASLNS